MHNVNSVTGTMMCPVFKNEIKYYKNCMLSAVHPRAEKTFFFFFLENNILTTLKWINVCFFSQLFVHVPSSLSSPLGRLYSLYCSEFPCPLFDLCVNVMLPGGMVVSWFEPSPFTSRRSCGWVWSLYVLPGPAWVSCMLSGFPTHSSLRQCLGWS